MGDRAHGDGGLDGTGRWLDAAQRAELGDLTSTAHALSVGGGVSVRREGGGLVVVEVAGDLAAGSAAYLDVVLEQEMNAAPSALVVDLSGTGFVGVRGIAALVRASGRAAANPTTFCVVTSLYDDLARHLRIAGLDELFDLHPSIADCRAALVRREPVSGPAVRSCRGSGGRAGGPGAGAAAEDAALRVEVQATGRLVVVRLSGSLSLRTVGAAAAALAKPLLEGGRVVADLSALRLRWTPALQVFPSALASLGGWPTARLVLLRADQEIVEALRALRIDRVVPLAAGMREARALIESRPEVVVRYDELPCEPGAPRRARALVRSACRDWGIEAVASDAAVVVSELVTNVVVHAGTGCRVSLRLDDHDLHVAVRDHQVADDAALHRVRSKATVGRGLRIVSAFSRAHGATAHPDGKTVWAVIALHPAT